jgi:RNA polymerase sigma-70 factor (ECF subfamily)
MARAVEHPPEDGAAQRASRPDAEADLFAKARGGNLFAFEEIVRRYQRRVYAVARRIVRRHEVADDVVQETFLRVWQNLGTFDASRPFGPWVCRIAANLAINHVRSPESDDPTQAPDPLENVLDGEAAAQLERALFSLNPEQRAVFVLRNVEELSYREIAEALDIEIGTVMSRLSRARERLRGALLPYLRAKGAGGAA